MNAPKVGAVARRGGIRPRTLGTIVVVAVGVVLAYDWYKHNTHGPVAGARPAAVAA